MKETVERRAVHIAAVIMQRDGLCRYEAPTDYGKVYPPDEAGCVKCIEKWLLGQAKKELSKKNKTRLDCLRTLPPKKLALWLEEELGRGIPTDWNAWMREADA